MKKHLQEVTVAPNIRKAMKREYKRLDRTNDLRRKRNNEYRDIAKEVVTDKEFRDAHRADIDAAGGIKNYTKQRLAKADAIVDKTYPARKINKNDLIPQGLEIEKFPYYVSVYDKYPIYEPAEGGYYYEGRQIVHSKGFNTYEEADAYAKELFDDEKDSYEHNYAGNGTYECDGRYIGDGVLISIENNKDYTKNEAGYQIYESYLRENKFSAGRHISYPLSVLLRSSINDDDFETAKTCLILGYKQIHNIVPNVFTESDMNTAIDEIEAIPTDLADYTTEDTSDNPGVDASEDARMDAWNTVIRDFFNTCDSLGIYVCTEGDKYKDEEDFTDTDAVVESPREYVYFACGKDVCDGPFAHEEAWALVDANPDKYDSVVEKVADKVVSETPAEEIADDEEKIENNDELLNS